ncbi:O-methyltransferase [Usnea florida]
MGTTRIAQLAALISSNTAKVDLYLKSQGLPPPSFDVDAPNDLGIPPQATDIDDARKAALEASIELQDLLQGSTSLLRPVFNGTSLHAIYKYEIAFKVPIHGSISFAQLAELCKIPELDVRRILRFAMVWHRCFCEPTEGFVAHTAASRQLAEDPRAHDVAGLMFDECWQSMARGHALAHNTHDSMFDWLGKNPAQAKRFTSAISTLVPSGRPASFLVESFDWASIGSGTVVDVGGSSGGVSILLAENFPALDFVVQDLPEAIEGAADKLPASLAHRIKFMTHDFFTDQPVVADIYLLRAIFHNWPDTYCIKILQKLIPALKRGAKIVINDSLVPGPGTLPLLAEKNIRAYDMLMMTLFNARERERADWIQLLRDADSRFKFVDAKKPGVGTMGVVQVIWNPVET